MWCSRTKVRYTRVKIGAKVRIMAFVGPGIGTNEANEPRVMQEAGEDWVCLLLLPSYWLVVAILIRRQISIGGNMEHWE